jgi:cytochrome b561
MSVARDTDLSYTRTAVILHWTIAILLLFELGVGSFMVRLVPPLKRIIVPLHFVAGIGVLALTVAMLMWRLAHRPPPRSIKGPIRAAALSRIASWLVYAMLLATPIVGWSIISAHPWAPGGGENIWGVFILPPIPPISHLDVSVQRSLHTVLVQIHTVGGWIFLAVLLLHMGIAIKRQFVDHEAELSRIGIGRISG